MRGEEGTNSHSLLSSSVSPAVVRALGSGSRLARLVQTLDCAVAEFVAAGKRAHVVTSQPHWLGEQWLHAQNQNSGIPARALLSAVVYTWTNACRSAGHIDFRIVCQLAVNRMHHALTFVITERNYRLSSMAGSLGGVKVNLRYGGLGLSLSKRLLLGPGISFDSPGPTGLL